ncbi:MAG: hypothetical protein GY711_21765 [bacterium]|nr:hypothetical protein [bacterium]
MKKRTRFALWILGVTAVYGAGYTARIYGPSVAELLHRAGVQPPAWAMEPGESIPEPTREVDAREALALLGEYMREINTRLDGLRTKRKEKEIAADLMAGRGGSDDSRVLRRLSEEREALDGQIAQLEALQREALDVEAPLQRYVDAETDVGRALDHDRRSLIDARTVLDRIERVGGL